MKLLTSVIVIIISVSLSAVSGVHNRELDAKNPGCVESAGIPCTSADL